MISLLRWYVDWFGVNKFLMRFVKKYLKSSNSYVLAIQGGNEEELDELNDLFKKGLI